MSPLVSVILPACNAANSIARVVADTRVQTLADWELIVVDDGSTDSTAVAAERAADGDPRVRVLRLPHGGVVAASRSARRAG
jgi:glycosyltransferase involved in cell wall biosynthesis